MNSQDNIQREILPIPDIPHLGLTTYGAKDPDTKYPLIKPLRPPKGAPNVLIVLIEDVGFGASSAFGGPIHTPTAERLADVGGRVTFSKRGSQTDAHTGRLVPDAICSDYRDGDTRYVLTYSRQKTLVSQKNIDLATGLQKVVAEIIRYPPGYLRFSGPVSLDRYQGGEVVEHYEEAGSFEQCYFAHQIHDEQEGEQAKSEARAL